MKNLRRLVWLDLEMTGLEIQNDYIIEIAAVITDSDLNIIAESNAIAIHQPDSVIANMNKWCQETHFASKLVQRVRDSKVLVSQAEQTILEFIMPYVDKNSSPLCGNSIWQDRKFLIKYMPTLESYFHYRLFDVTAFKIASMLWKPELQYKFNKTHSHLALEDIRESINEMKFYRQNLFKTL